MRNSNKGNLLIAELIGNRELPDSDFYNWETLHAILNIIREKGYVTVIGYNWCVITTKDKANMGIGLAMAEDEDNRMAVYKAIVEFAKWDKTNKFCFSEN